MADPGIGQKDDARVRPSREARVTRPSDGTIALLP